MSYELEEISLLVVEDTFPMLVLAKSLLHIFGFRNIHIAKSGEEGYDLYKQYEPDVVITDWFMEPMDGIALTKKIREDKDSPNPYVPIIMISGYASRMRVEDARDNGVTEFVIKPYTAKDLYNKIIQLIEHPRPFVKVDNFFGPDRRRQNIDYSGPLRREDDEDDGDKEIDHYSERNEKMRSAAEDVMKENKK